MTKGVPFRTAHHIVGTLVARCEKEGKHALGQLSVDAFNEVIATKSDVRITDDVYNALGAGMSSSDIRARARRVENRSRNN